MDTPGGEVCAKRGPAEPGGAESAIRKFSGYGIPFIFNLLEAGSEPGGGSLKGSWRLSCLYPLVERCFCGSLGRLSTQRPKLRDFPH